MDSSLIVVNSCQTSYKVTFKNYFNSFSSVNCHVHVMNEYNKPNKKTVLELFACMLVIH